MTLRAKFTCNGIADHRPPNYPNAIGSTEVSLSAIYSNSKEDNQFSEATPYGNLKMTITTETAKNFFKVGGSYYLDFTEVES